MVVVVVVVVVEVVVVVVGSVVVGVGDSVCVTVLVWVGAGAGATEPALVVVECEVVELVAGPDESPSASETTAYTTRAIRTAPSAPRPRSPAGLRYHGIGATGGS